MRWLIEAAVCWVDKTFAADGRVNFLVIAFSFIASIIGTGATWELGVAIGKLNATYEYVIASKQRDVDLAARLDGNDRVAAAHGAEIGELTSREARLEGEVDTMRSFDPEHRRSGLGPGGGPYDGGRPEYCLHHASAC